jgi:FkbH-like protein
VFKKSFISVDGYLKSLEMELNIYEASKFTIPRIAQMTQKTNQFNLTSKRYTDDDIKNKVLNEDLVFCAAVKDKFGDNGISILSIINIVNNTALIDSFLLSCRILGRNIEVAFLNYLINLLQEKNIKYLKSVYIPSNKNKQTENFFEKMNFELVNIDDNGIKHYNLEIIKKRKIEEYYKINFITNE